MQHEISLSFPLHRCRNPKSRTLGFPNSATPSGTDRPTGMATTSVLVSQILSPRIASGGRGMEAADKCSWHNDDYDPNPPRPFGDEAAFLASLTSLRIKVAVKLQLQLRTPFWPLRVTPHVAEKAANWLGDSGRRRGARSRRGPGWGEVKKLQPQSSLRVRQREFGLGPQLPVPLAMSLVSFQNAEDEERPGGWRPSAINSPKGGKGELPFPIGSARLRLRPDTCRHLAPSEAPQTNPIPGVP